MAKQYSPPFLQQQGSALIFSLLILTVITISAMVAIQRSTLQLRMVNSMQHSQEVFNATYDHLSQGVNYLKSNMGVTRTALSTLIQTDTDQLPTLSLEDSTSWTVPDKPNTVGTITDQLSLSEETAAASPNNLKNNAGSSSGSMTTYHFTYNATGSDTAGKISSSQEIVFSLAGPSL